MAGSDFRSQESAEPPSAQDNNPESTTLTSPPAIENPLVRTTADARRLYWTLSGPLSASVWVMAEPFYDPSAPLEPYVREGSGADVDASVLHPVLQAPLTESRIASTTVSVRALNEWEELWVEMHDRHWEGPEEG